MESVDIVTEISEPLNYDAYQIHILGHNDDGYCSSSSGKSEFDEEYFRHCPKAVTFNESEIVTVGNEIKKMTNSSHYLPGFNLQINNPTLTAKITHTVDYFQTLDLNSTSHKTTSWKSTEANINNYNPFLDRPKSTMLNSYQKIPPTGTYNPWNKNNVLEQKQINCNDQKVQHDDLIVSHGDYSPPKLLLPSNPKTIIRKNVLVPELEQNSRNFNSNKTKLSEQSHTNGQILNARMLMPETHQEILRTMKNRSIKKNSNIHEAPSVSRNVKSPYIPEENSVMSDPEPYFQNGLQRKNSDIVNRTTTQSAYRETNASIYGEINNKSETHQKISQTIKNESIKKNSNIHAPSVSRNVTPHLFKENSVISGEEPYFQNGIQISNKSIPAQINLSTSAQQNTTERIEDATLSSRTTVACNDQLSEYSQIAQLHGTQNMSNQNTDLTTLLVEQETLWQKWWTFLCCKRKNGWAG